MNRFDAWTVTWLPRIAIGFAGMFLVLALYFGDAGEAGFLVVPIAFFFVVHLGVFGVRLKVPGAHGLEDAKRVWSYNERYRRLFWSFISGELAALMYAVLQAFRSHEWLWHYEICMIPLWCIMWGMFGAGLGVVFNVARDSIVGDA